jgi:fumarylacetoacetate (FAA) hydrolase
MKLASLAQGRDGQLVVVDRALQRMLPVPHIAPTLQHALDRWSLCKPQLAEVQDSLEAGDFPGTLPYDPLRLAAPLPRAYQWADGSAYVHHVELVRKARGAELPDSFWRDPLMYQGGSDRMLAPHEPIRVADEAWGIDFEAEVAVITDDVPMGVSVAAAGDHIQLLVLVNDVSLRHLIPAELAKGFGFFQSKPASTLSPVAVTPDELGPAWRDRKVHLPLISALNGDRFGWPDAGQDMTFDFAQLISHAAKTRSLGSGSIVGSGTVSNRDPTRGSSCIAERRMLEQLESGAPRTSFLRYGDRIRIEMLDAQGRSVFGAIDQVVVAP